MLVDTAARSLAAQQNCLIKKHNKIGQFREMSECVRLSAKQHFEIEIEMTEYGSIFAIEFAF